MTRAASVIACIGIAACTSGPRPQGVSQQAPTGVAAPTIPGPPSNDQTAERDAPRGGW